MKHLFLAILLVFSFSIFADNHVGQINAEKILVKGTREIGGRLKISDDSDFTYSISAQYSHFIKDKLSVGALASISRTAGDTISSLGVAANYYFLVKDSLAPYIAQEIIASYNDETDWFGNSQLGIAYFFTNHTAFKIFGQLSYQLEDIDSPSFDLLGQFSIFF